MTEIWGRILNNFFHTFCKLASDFSSTLKFFSCPWNFSQVCSKFPQISFQVSWESFEIFLKFFLYFLQETIKYSPKILQISFQ